MIDYFALGLTHFLILVAVIRLTGRDDLDHEPRMSERRRRPRHKLKGNLGANARGAEDRRA